MVLNTLKNRLSTESDNADPRRSAKVAGLSLSGYSLLTKTSGRETTPRQLMYPPRHSHIECPEHGTPSVGIMHVNIKKICSIMLVGVDPILMCFAVGALTATSGYMAGRYINFLFAILQMAFLIAIFWNMVKTQFMLHMIFMSYV